jgi:Phage-related protein, predicted endonuclease
MTERKLNNRVKKWLEIREQIKALEEQQKALEDEIKAEFADDQEEIKTGSYLIRWTRYTSPRIDSAKLKKDLPDVYRLYTKITEGRRFSVA